MVVVDDSIQEAHLYSPSQVAWSEGWRPLGAVLRSSDEPSKLSQWPCGRDDSITHIVLGIIIEWRCRLLAWTTELCNRSPTPMSSFLTLCLFSEFSLVALVFWGLAVAVSIVKLAWKWCLHSAANVRANAKKRRQHCKTRTVWQHKNVWNIPKRTKMPRT